MCTRVMSTEACPRPRRFGISTCRPAPGSDLQGLHVLNKRASHTCQPSCPGAGMGLKKKSEYFWSRWMCVCVCVLAVWWCSVGRSLHTVAALNPQGTAHIHIQIPDTYPAWNTHTHTALFSIRSWLERKASKQLVKKKVHSSSRKSFAYFFFFCRSDSPSDERTLLCLLIFIADE